MVSKSLKVRSSSIAAIQRKLDSLRKVRQLAEANDCHQKPRFQDLENDVFGSEDYFSED